MAQINLLDRPNLSYKRSTNLVSISPPSWSRMNSGVRQMSQLRYNRPSILSWMQQYMTHASLSSKSRRQSLHRRCHSPLLHHYDRCHPLYKLPGRTADQLRLDHRLRARARGQTESLPRRQRSTSGLRTGATLPFLPPKIRSFFLRTISE
jgi:hypothetical protein